MDLFAEMCRRVPELNADADEWTREMMRWHFSDTTGAPFWLRQRARLQFDPLNDVRCFDDLRLFGLMNKDAMRATPIIDFVPRGFADRPRRIFETGGTSGPPCRVVDVTKGAYDVALYRVVLESRGLVGGDVLAMTPSGPHAYGTFVTRLADTWCGNVFSIDFDPRWVKHLIRRGMDSAAYIAHLTAQTRELLEIQRPSLLFTTSKLLMALVAGLGKPLSTFGVRAVCTGGTSCSPEEERYLREVYLDGVDWIDTYGNTLMGHALQGDAWFGLARRSYYLPPPQAHIRIVDSDDWTVDKREGERGRVLLVTLHRDLLIPNLLERDSAIRVGSHPYFPFPGVTAVEPMLETTHDVEGVY